MTQTRMGAFADALKRAGVCTRTPARTQEKTAFQIFKKPALNAPLSVAARSKIYCQYVKDCKEDRALAILQAHAIRNMESAHALAPILYAMSLFPKCPQFPDTPVFRSALRLMEAAESWISTTPIDYWVKAMVSPMYDAIPASDKYSKERRLHNEKQGKSYVGPRMTRKRRETPQSQFGIHHFL